MTPQTHVVPPSRVGPPTCPPGVNPLFQTRKRTLWDLTAHLVGIPPPSCTNSAAVRHIPRPACILSASLDHIELQFTPLCRNPHHMLPHAGPAKPSGPAAAAAAAAGSRPFAAAAAAGGAGACSSSAAASKAAAAAFARQQQQQLLLPGELSVSWGDLPPDVRSSILSQLTPQDLARAASTCGEFRDWANAMRAHVRLCLGGWGPAASLTVHTHMQPVGQEWCALCSHESGRCAHATAGACCMP